MRINPWAEQWEHFIHFTNKDVKTRMNTVLVSRFGYFVQRICSVNLHFFLTYISQWNKNSTPTPYPWHVFSIGHYSWPHISQHLTASLTVSAGKICETIHTKCGISVDILSVSRRVIQSPCQNLVFVYLPTEVNLKVSPHVEKPETLITLPHNSSNSWLFLKPSL